MDETIIPDDENASCDTGTFETPDGRFLFCRCWGATDAATAILVVHGLGEHSGWYDRFATALCQRGYAVMAFDQQGHGRSPGTPGRILSYDQLLDDIQHANAELARRFPDSRAVLLGHSMGGNLLLNYLLRCSEHAPPAIVTNPMILPADPPTRPQIFAAWLTGKLIPWLRISASIEPSSLTQDGEIVREFATDPHVHDKMSLELGTQLLSRGQELLDESWSLTSPMLVLIGEEDDLCDRASIQTLVQRVGPSCQIRSWADLRHSLLIEEDRREVYDVILEWLDQLE